MNSAGSTLHTTELAEALSAGPGDVVAQYADGDIALVDRVETTATGVMLFLETDSIQTAMNTFVEQLQAITELPTKGGRKAVMDAVADLLKTAETWTN
jgi:hypothetical protein